MTSAELERLLPAFADLLQDSVNHGASLGLRPPLSAESARSYWRSLCPELERGSRLLLVAYTDHRLVGSVQLALPVPPSARHRAEPQMLIVRSTLRGRGVDRSLMAALHDMARRRGRSLLLLSTRRGGRDEDFYRNIGYRELRIVPGHSGGRDEEPRESVMLYRELTA